MRVINEDALRKHVAAFPDLTQNERAAHFGVSRSCIGYGLRKSLMGGEDPGDGGVLPGTIGAGGGSSSRGTGLLDYLFKGGGGEQGSVGIGDNWLARALPKEKKKGGFFRGIKGWADRGIGEMRGNIAATQGFDWQGLGALFGSTSTGSLAAGLSTVASPFVLTSAAAMGAEALGHSADVLTATSGTGNWFTQSFKDIGYFLGDTFSFDNPWNDRLARKVGARQQIQAAKRHAKQLGHSSAMDLLAEHAQGFEQEVDAMHRRQGAAMGMGDDKTLWRISQSFKRTVDGSVSRKTKDNGLNSHGKGLSRRLSGGSRDVIDPYVVNNRHYRIREFKQS